MPNEIESLAQNRIDADTRRLPIGIEEIKFYVWAVRGLLVGVVLATLWFSRTEYRFNKLNEWIVAEEKIDAGWAAKNEKHDTYITSNNIVNLSTQNQIDSLRNRVVVNEATTSAMLPKLNEMWFLKEHGIDNSAEFIRKQFNPGPSPAPKSP